MGWQLGDAGEATATGHLGTVDDTVGGTDGCSAFRPMRLAGIQPSLWCDAQPGDGPLLAIAAWPLTRSARFAALVIDRTERATVFKAVLGKLGRLGMVRWRCCRCHWIAEAHDSQATTIGACRSAAELLFRGLRGRIGVIHSGSRRLSGG